VDTSGVPGVDRAGTNRKRDTMTNWKFGKNEVLVRDNEWWHVRHRRQCVDCEDREYVLADATHTDYKTLHADDVEGWDGYEGLFESDGWETTHKPASVNGYRVNGVLCGPEGLNHRQGQECVHERECPNCGADGMGEIDIIHAIEDKEVVDTQCECRECETVWEGA